MPKTALEITGEILVASLQGRTGSLNSQITALAFEEIYKTIHRLEQEQKQAAKTS